MLMMCDVEAIMRAVWCGRWLLIGVVISLQRHGAVVQALHRLDVVAGVAPDNHPPASSYSLIDQDAIHKLSEIFDIPTLKSTRHFPVDEGNSSQSGLSRSDFLAGSGRDQGLDQGLNQPPQYMLNLYQTIADNNGVMRIPNPYHANLIKSFNNKDVEGRQSVLFDTKWLQEGEQERQSILQAEMHVDLSINLGLLFAKYNASANHQEEEEEAVTCGHLLLNVYLRQKSSHGKGAAARGRLVAQKALYLDQCLQDHPLWTSTPSSSSQGQTLYNTSQVVAVGAAVDHWTSFPDHNHGLEVDVSLVMPSSWLDARLNSSLFPYTIRQWSSHPRITTSSQVGQPAFSICKGKSGPVLILFMDDGRPGRNPKYRITDSAKQQAFLKRRLGRLGQSELYQSYSEAADFDWNEEDNSGIRVRSRRSRKPAAVPLTTRTIFMLGGAAPPRKYKKVKGPVKKFKDGRKGRGNKRNRSPDQQCRRHQLYISFEEIGWSNWIISPKGFQAFHCRGTCNFPIGQESKPSNHATVLSIISHLKIRKNVAPPCCVPEKLYSISLLFFDAQKNVVLRQYDDMVAQSCACR